jgi:hypothetical protein
MATQSSEAVDSLRTAEILRTAEVLNTVEVLRARGVVIGPVPLAIITRMRDYCASQGAGVEFLMLLFVVPVSPSILDGVRPRALLRDLCALVLGRERDVVWEDRGLRPAFARDVSLYVAAVSPIPDYGRGLALLEPGPECGVDLLRAFVVAPNPGSVVRYLVAQLRALALLPVAATVKVAVALSQRSVQETGRRDEVAFSVHVVATTRVHAKITDILRRRARSRRERLRARISGSEGEAEWCDALASVEGFWDGEFDEAPPPARACGDAVFLPPSLLLCGTDTDPGAVPMLPYLPRVAELVAPTS